MCCEGRRRRSQELPVIAGMEKPGRLQPRKEMWPCLPTALLPPGSARGTVHTRALQAPGDCVLPLPSEA